MLKLHNTYKQALDEFKPIKEGTVGLYTCGPTVYNYAHLGNMRYFIFQDTLRRTLEFLGYKVKHIMNVTDVGHLTGENLGDADQGEDKMEKGAKREHKTVWEVAEFYTEKYLEDADKLNILKAHKLVRATKAIKPIIKLVGELLDKGFAYETDTAVYFDVSKFPAYEKLTGQKLEEKLQAVRDEVVQDPSKRQPADFALWFKTVGRFQNHVMRWDSPWGEGFPGWHIECSAISSKYLGQPFDVHTGGVDHIQVHHANEIAQSEAAKGKPLANYWLHSEHMLVEGQKISKSLENDIILDEIIEEGYTPLDFRYLVLTAHYRNKLNFTWEGLGAAARAFRNLRTGIEDYEKATRPDPGFLDKFKTALGQDLDTPRALTVLWDLVRNSKLETGVKRATVNAFDEVLALDLTNIKPKPLTKEVKKLIADRDRARAKNDWDKADALRFELEKLGYEVKDTPSGTTIKRA